MEASAPSAPSGASAASSTQASQPWSARGGRNWRANRASCPERSRPTSRPPSSSSKHAGSPLALSSSMAVSLTARAAAGASERPFAELLGGGEDALARDRARVAGSAFHRRERPVGAGSRPRRHDPGRRHEDDRSRALLVPAMEPSFDQPAARGGSADRRRDEGPGFGVVQQDYGAAVGGERRSRRMASERPRERARSSAALRRAALGSGRKSVS